MAAAVPLLIFSLLVALGVYGTVAGSHSMARYKRDLAVSSATDVGTNFVLQVIALITMPSGAYAHAYACIAPCIYKVQGGRGKQFQDNHWNWLQLPL